MLREAVLVLLIGVSHCRLIPEESGQRSPAAASGHSGHGQRTARSAEIDYPVLPVTGFRCSQQQYPGIYADVEAGCQLFHFCEASGKNSTFFCPSLTLFNQQFFVCDWAYNVECSAATQFYALNQNIYITPDKIYAAQPLIDTVDQTAATSLRQPKILSVSTGSEKVQDSVAHAASHLDNKGSGSEVSRTLTSLDSSQLHSQSSPTHVQDASLGNALIGGYRPGNASPSSISRPQQGSVPEGSKGTTPSPSSSSSYPVSTYSTASLPAPASTYPSSYATTTTAPSYLTTTKPTPTTAVYDDASDPEPVYAYAPLPTYAPAASYQDSGDNSVAGYSSYDDVADPEPAGYSSGSGYSSGGSSGGNYGYDPYDSADPEPAAYYDSADPEPIGYYSGGGTVDLSSNSYAVDNTQASYSGSSYPAASQNQQASYSSPQTSYDSIDTFSAPINTYKSSSTSASAAAPASSGYYDDVADPEPNDPYYAQQIDFTGSQSKSGYNIYSSDSTLTNFYKDYPSSGYVVDSADPEPDPEYTPYSN